MDAGETTREETSELKEYPENYDEMIKKLQERDEEQLKKILLKRKAETFEELKEIATKAIVKRSTRASGEYKPLKDRTIITEAKAEDIEDLKKQLGEETNAIAQRIIKELPKHLPTLEKKVIGLKGRIQKSPPGVNPVA